MDVSVLPLAEVDLKVDDVAIKFENDDDNEEFDAINGQYEGEYCEPSDVAEGLNFVRPPNGYGDKVNYHFMSSPGEKTNSTAPVRRYQCPDCPKCFTRSDHLKSHMRMHTGERPYECDTCQKAFARHFDLTRHKQSIHGSVTTFFICEECGRTFSRKDHLKSHLLSHKNRPEKTTGDDDVNAMMKTLTCETCGRIYGRLEHLKKHMEEHCENVSQGGAKRFPKEIINDLKDETITENLFKGISFHFMSVNDVKAVPDHSLRPFACEFCDRLFVRKDHLKNHERTHTGERPFQCEKCDKRFAKRFVMTRHLRNVHGGTNTKMHKCTECERMFARTDHLKTHMKIHILAAVKNQQRKAAEKAHKCDVCHREFTRSDNLKTHMKIHMLAAVKMQQQQQQQQQQQHQEEDEDDETGGSRDSSSIMAAMMMMMGASGGGGGGHDEGEDVSGVIVGGQYFCEMCEMSFSDVEGLEKHEKSHKDS